MPSVTWHWLPYWVCGGIALASSLSIGIAAVLNVWLLQRTHRGVALRPLAGLMGRALLLAGVALLAGTAARELTTDLPVPVTGLAAGGATVGAYALGLVMLRAPEATTTFEAFVQVLRRRRRRS